MEPHSGHAAPTRSRSLSFGAYHFIDDTTEDVAEALNRVGGARAVLATVTNAKAMPPVIEGSRCAPALS
jgi:D-arabinose 1-dehydrogenase-like Zn-dependent alcohol dehydrogenase